MPPIAVAEALGKVPTRNKLRFAWWSAEELGAYSSDLPGPDTHAAATTKRTATSADAGHQGRAKS
ncbi:hypothetical protein AB0392_34395 [Nonomuraea angiospora]|uniref:hypothetical protein n=1 Tax=Nonomuraea angiospora TaxID=46172 RepID=UPI0034508935